MSEGNSERLRNGVARWWRDVLQMAIAGLALMAISGGVVMNQKLASMQEAQGQILKRLDRIEERANQRAEKQREDLQALRSRLRFLELRQRIDGAESRPGRGGGYGEQHND